MTDEQKVMYTGICMCRNTEVTLFWSRHQVFVLINLAALPLLLTEHTLIFYQLVAGMGFLLCTYWSIINCETEEIIDYWESRLASIEPSEESNLIAFCVFTGRDWKEANEFLKFLSKYRIALFPGFFTYIWLGIIIYLLFF